MASSHAAEAIAHQGVDSVTIDLQHGAIDFAAAFQMLQGISTSPAVPLARVPWNEPAIMTKLLDAGAYGIICPMIETEAEARAFVAACRYPPMGSRSYGPNRVSFYAGTDYAGQANREILLLAQVETRRAVENVNAILSVPGLDGVYIGPGDLSLSFGVAPSMDPTDAAVVQAMADVRERARSSGLIAAVHTRRGGDGAAALFRGISVLLAADGCAASHRCREGRGAGGKARGISGVVEGGAAAFAAGGHLTTVGSLLVEGVGVHADG
jgi:4-hydroxy-2-oxoheptanedioate aldolase